MKINEINDLIYLFSIENTKNNTAKIQKRNKQQNVLFSRQRKPKKRNNTNAK